jgi:hypothetical protein
VPRAGQRHGTHQDLAAIGNRPNARRLVHPGPGVVQPDPIDLGSVDPDADRQREPVRTPLFGEAALDADGRLDGLVGIGEGKEEAIAGSASV